MLISNIHRAWTCLSIKGCFSKDHAAGAIQKCFCSSVFDQAPKQNLKQSCIPKEAHLRLQSFLIISDSDWKEEERTGREPGMYLIWCSSNSLTYSAGKQLSLLCLLASPVLSQILRWPRLFSLCWVGYSVEELCPGPSLPCSSAMPLVKLCLLLLLLPFSEH